MILFGQLPPSVPVLSDARITAFLGDIALYAWLSRGLIAILGSCCHRCTLAGPLQALPSYHHASCFDAAFPRLLFVMLYTPDFW